MNTQLTWVELLRATIPVLKARGKDVARNRDFYEFIPIYNAVYPDNNFVVEKVCETLQQLHAAGDIERVKRGRYLLK